MREILRNALHALAWRWPALLAALMIGWVIHIFGIQLSAQVATRIPWLGLTILPLAILGYLVSYIVVFRMIRPFLPAYEGVDRDELAVLDAPDAQDKGAFQAASDVATAVILPFFLMWAAWGFFDDDLDLYVDQVNRRFIYQEGGPAEKPVEFDITGQVFLVILLVVAILMKWLCGRLMDRYPVFGIIGTYFEALWVFLLSVTVISPLVNVAGWVADSAMWVSLSRSWDAFVESLAPLHWLWASVIVPVWDLALRVFVAVLYPLAWFALAAIVMGRPVSDAAARRALLAKIPRLEHWVDRVNADWRRSPGPFKAFVAEIGSDLTVRAVSVVGAVTALRRLGIVRIVGYVLAWAVLDWLNRWLMVGFVHLVGAQPNAFWIQYFNYALIIPWLITESLRVVLVGAAYDSALRREAAVLRGDLPVSG